jgi:hypothetical protein
MYHLVLAKARDHPNKRLKCGLLSDSYSEPILAYRCPAQEHELARCAASAR